MRKLFTILLSLLTILSLAGCTYHYTEDLREELLNQCYEGAVKWISTIDGAKYVDGDLMCFFRLAADAMEGRFAIGEDSYEFYYLSATDEFYTDMYDKQMAQRVIDEITTDFQMNIISADHLYERLVHVDYHEVSNQKGNKKTDITYSPLSRDIYGCKLLTTQQEVEERYHFMVYDSDYGQLFIMMIVDDVQAFMDKVGNEEFIKRYPKIKIQFTDQDPDSDSFMLVTSPNGANIERVKRDDKGNIAQEIIKVIEYENVP